MFTRRAHRVLAPCSFCLPAIRIVRQMTFFIHKVLSSLSYHSNIKLKQSKSNNGRYYLPVEKEN